MHITIDNYAIHDDEVHELIVGDWGKLNVQLHPLMTFAGAKLYLPLYSLNFNLIEQTFHSKHGSDDTKQKLLGWKCTHS